jgi:hypothetical protein
VWVNVSSPSTGAFNGTQTAADGTYTVTGLPTATDYQVCFNASGATGGHADTPGYVDQCYNNQPGTGPGTPVSVTAGVNRTGINAALAAGGAISGTVTDAGGTHQGLENVWVNVSSPSTGDYGTQTDASGNYTVAVPPGTDYRVCFIADGVTGGSSSTGYVDECYNNQPPSGTPTPVTVTAGATTPGINAALAAGAGISGTTPPGAGGTLSRTTPGVGGTLSPVAPGAGASSHWLAVQRRMAAHGFARPLALVRLGTALLPYRFGPRAVAQSQHSQLRRDALARHLSPGLTGSGLTRSGLTRSLIGSR